MAQFGRDFAGRAVYFGAGPCADPQILDVAEDENGLRIHFRAGGSRGPAHAAHCPARTTRKTPWRRSPSPLKRASTLMPRPRPLRRSTPATSAARPSQIAGATILNDSYNSNPEALQSMIRTLARRPARRRILVAGEMLELGEHAPILHYTCGKSSSGSGHRYRGRRSRQCRASGRCRLHGWSGCLFLPDAETAGDWLGQNLRKGDLVLVKGSRGVHLERAIEIATKAFGAEQKAGSPTC